MVASLQAHFLEPKDYLEAEQDRPTKHEYRQGYAYAMAGASNTHVLIAGNFFALRKKPRSGWRLSSLHLRYQGSCRAV